MSDYPLPLIRRRASSLLKPDRSMPIHSRAPFENLFAEENLSLLRAQGIAVLVGTVIIMVIGMASVFDLNAWLVPPSVARAWQRWVVGETNDFPMDGYYICALIVTAAVFWVWASIHWLGMTLFVFTKGSHVPPPCPVPATGAIRGVSSPGPGS